jgi:hypothetical protein
MPIRTLMLIIPLLAAATPPRAAAQVAGTYRVLLCRSACAVDSSGAFARGILVLSDSVLKGKDGKPIAIAFREHPANGCFAQDSGTHRTLSYATFRKATVLDWARLPGGWIEFELYQSPDANYTVTLKQWGARLIGIGQEAGYGAAEFHPPPDSVVAIRLGPPRPAVCPWFK